MFRIIANRMKGRTKSIEETPTVQEALALLDELNGNTKGNIHCDRGFSNYIGLSGIAPRDMVDFVGEKFSEGKDFYNNIRHQVYAGEKEEKHYLDLAHGQIEGRFGEIAVKGRPYRKASINFLVEK